MEENLTDLQRLLRLKRHEAPSPDFLEDFLCEFHQRQRAELLKRSVWRLALDRLEGALPTFQLTQYTYAGACATALLFAGVAASHVLKTPSVHHSAKGVAVVDLSSAKFGQTEQAAPQVFYPPAPQVAVRQSRLNIYSQRPMVSLAELDFEKPRPQTAGAGAAMRNPRYVLDTQPVSYEQPESF